MKTLSFLTLLILCAAAPAQAKLSISSGAADLGTGSISQKISADGTKTVELRMELVSGGKKVQIRSQNSYDAKGRPVRKFLETIIPGGQLQTQKVATFGPEGASVVILGGDKRETKTVALVDTGPRENASEFWFLREQPKPGALVECFAFSMDSLEWVLTRTTYVGPKEINVSGRKVRAHEVVSKQGDRTIRSFLDDKGLPLLVDDGRMKISRVFDK